MRRRIFIVMVLLAGASLVARGGAAPAVGGPPALAQPVAVRVATYNLRNYSAADRRVEGQFRPDWPKPEAEKTALREVIRAARADVLALQEIGDERYLAELRRDLAREGLDYPHFAALEGPDGVRRLAVLSRLPFVSVARHANISFRLNEAPAESKRGLLEVTFNTAGQAWTLYVVHLKSRLTDTPGDPLSATQREAEARAMRDFMRQRPPFVSIEQTAATPPPRAAGEAGSPIAPPNAFAAVAGDFNDTRDTPALRRFLEVNGRPLFQIAAAADSRGETWTYRFAAAERYDRVDFILLTPALAARQTAGGVVDLPAATTASDHRLVWADLVFMPARAVTSPPLAAQISRDNFNGELSNSFLTE